MGLFLGLVPSRPAGCSFMFTLELMSDGSLLIKGPVQSPEDGGVAVIQSGFTCFVN